MDLTSRTGWVEKGRDATGGECRQRAMVYHGQRCCEGGLEMNGLTSFMRPTGECKKTSSWLNCQLHSRCVDYRSSMLRP